MKKLHPRWRDAARDVIKNLVDREIDFSNFTSLEMFARGGDWQTIEFAKISSLEAWEVDNSFEPKLRKNLPNSKIRFVDSIQTLQENNNLSKYDLIIIDAPLNTFGPIENGSKYGKYCEHFTFLKDVGNLIGEKAIVIINVNRSPFDYEKYPEWKKRRDEFYKYHDTGSIPIDFLLNFYKKFFLDIGFQTKFSFNVVRVFYEGKDIIHFLVFMLKRINKV